MKHYAKRDPIALDQAGGYYRRHVSAMTTEGLHSKADIAAEFGWRDVEIDRLHAALEKVTGVTWRSLWTDAPTPRALIILRRKVDDETWSRMKRDNPDLYRRGDFAFDIDCWERLTPNYAGRLGFTEYMEMPR